MTPNTDCDEQDLEYNAEGTIEPGVESATALEAASESSKGPEQHPAHVYNHDMDGNNRGPTDYIRSECGNIPTPTFDSASEIPLTHDLVENGAPSTYSTKASDHDNVDQLMRTASASDVFSSTGLAGWHASPTSNPHSSPHAHKKSPFESIHNISPFANSTFSPTPSLYLRWPVSNAYEASLLHHYIVYCTGWIDVCDSRRYFEKEVPKRAAQFPVILNGILGLAARHLWLMGKAIEDHSQSYVDQCLQALIVALEDPLAHWDENFLVAVILLRLHEEMGDADEQCHHFGKLRPGSGSTSSWDSFTMYSAPQRRSTRIIRAACVADAHQYSNDKQVLLVFSIVYRPLLPMVASASPLLGCLFDNTSTLV